MNYSIHLLRAVAIFLVVLGHSLFVPYSGQISEFRRVLLVLLGEGTTVFVLVSGFLFCLLNYNYSYTRFLSNKVKNVLYPYLLMSVPAILIYALGIKSDHDWLDLNWLSEKGIWYVVFYFYLTGAHLGPYWYIPVIFMIFIMSPLSVMLFRTSYPLLILFFFIFLPIVIPRSPDNSDLVQSFIHYYSLFIVGGILCIYRTQLERSWIWIGFGVTFVLFSYFSFRFQEFPLFLSKLFLFIFLYGFFSRFYTRFSWALIFRLLDMVAVFSFPIYFVHGYFISSLKMFAYSDQVDSALLYSCHVLLVGLGVAFVSILFAFVVARTFRTHARYMVGLNYNEFRRLSL